MGQFLKNYKILILFRLSIIISNCCIFLNLHSSTYYHRNIILSYKIKQFKNYSLEFKHRRFQKYQLFNNLQKKKINILILKKKEQN